MKKLRSRNNAVPSINPHHDILQVIMSFRDLVGHDATNDFAHTELEDFNIGDDFLDDAIARMDEYAERNWMMGHDPRIFHATRAFLNFLRELPKEWRE